MGKLFDRIVTNHINTHLSREGPVLDDDQFGFRKRCSTIDAVECARSLEESAILQGRVVLTISIDNVNVFNSLL